MVQVKTEVNEAEKKEEEVIEVSIKFKERESKKIQQMKHVYNKIFCVVFKLSLMSLTEITTIAVAFDHYLYIHIDTRHNDMVITAMTTFRPETSLYIYTSTKLERQEKKYTPK